MFQLNNTFTELLLTHWAENKSHEHTISVSSYDLSIADVVAVSRHLTQVCLRPEAETAIEKCSNIIQQKIARGEIIYGVNTGFGGSADTRTGAVDELQQSLFHLLMAGITAGREPKVQSHSPAPKSLVNGRDHGQTNGHTKPNGHTVSHALPLSQASTTTMPESWVRASMLVRLNSLAAGASGVSLSITDVLLQMLNKDIVPLVPLRGSISASGDLQPLSYIGAVLQGKKYASAYCGSRSADQRRRLVRADVALREADIEPANIRAKEGLAIVNGTAVSAGVAALALHESLGLAALAQVLTAMTVEALLGTDESFDPFIARVRPHPGQIDSARNILAFLSGSRLALSEINISPAGELRQDRYSVRTASQWLGPVLEDLLLAHTQITTELNSVTDNPLIDVATDRILHGGNFQAKAVTSAVEKVRQGLQSIGRMLFSQLTELINPATNRGLPANLVADDPARSYLFKGTDIMAAALTSELGFLANPVGCHVQTAEMGNQGINSLALISARYTLDAVDVLSQLMAAHLVALCQALDLRVRDMLSQKSPTSEERNEVLDATPYLGNAARRMYRYIRNDLGVPFLTEDHVSGQLEGDEEGLAPSVGAYNTIVYEAIQSGHLYNVVVDCLEEANVDTIMSGGVNCRSAMN